MTTRTVSSSWLSSLTYIPLAASYRAQLPDKGFVRFTLASGAELTYLTESWRFGLLLTHKSAGRAYNLLVRNRCTRVA